MPGIFVREGYLESSRVAALFGNPAAERFYFHLLLVANEDGTFDADPVLLRNRCFPAVDSIRTTDVSRWIADCETAGLVRLFVDAATGKKRIEVLRHEPAEHRMRNASFGGKCTESIPNDSDSVLPFAEFWDMYDKKVERAKCIQKYAAISETDRAEIRRKLPGYIAATPDPQFRKNPQTWLNGRCWQDEMLPPQRERGISPEMRKRKGF